jgi:hypothetical protein
MADAITSDPETDADPAVANRPPTRSIISLAMPGWLVAIHLRLTGQQPKEKRMPCAGCCPRAHGPIDTFKLWGA